MMQCRKSLSLSSVSKGRQTRGHPSNGHGQDLYSRLLRWITAAGAVVTFGMLLYMMIDIVIKGLPGLQPDLFAWNYNSENVSLMPALINTLFLTALTLLLSVPLSVACALFLSEFSRPGSRISRWTLLAVQTLSGVPSIVFGLFGSLFFVRFCHMGLSLLAGALTMTILVLPAGIKTAQEALREVPVSFREASYGLGAGKARTIFRIVLPAAMPGILNGIVLCTGRIVGESAALIFTAGTLTQVSTSLFSSARTLAVHMYALASEGLYLQQSYATALVLLLFTSLLNALSGLVGAYMERRSRHG